LLGTLGDKQQSLWRRISLSIGTTLLGNLEGLSCLRTFEIQRYTKRYIKMPCKWVSLSIAAPLEDVEEIRLSRLFERKGQYMWVPFLDPEDIEILSLGAIWKFGKGTGLY
jgi:hypothetical protein